jgi:hypothetical protein
VSDKSTALVLAGLSQAAAQPHGAPLHGQKAHPGLFANSVAGKQAARRCLDEGFLQVVRTETLVKAVQPVCAITEKGLSYLLSQVSPRQVLEDFVRVLEARQSQAEKLLEGAGQIRSCLTELKSSAEKVLDRLRQEGHAHSAGPFTNGTLRQREPDSWLSEMLSVLNQRQESGASEDYPLPELYRKAQQAADHLTIGQFHDGLRRLYEEEQIYLHPWTGPLYAMPEPRYALLIGHEVAYYASIRRKG